MQQLQYGQGMGGMQPQYGQGMQQQQMNSYGFNQNTGANPLYNDGMYQGGMQQNGQCMNQGQQGQQQNATPETTGATSVKQTTL
jgi:hypothetical protein